MDVQPEWPFDDPPNLATITTRAIMDGTDWIAWVAHDADDGCWQFIGSEGFDLESAMVVGLRHFIEKDSSVTELADLPLGWQAWRVGPDMPWQREPQTQSDDQQEID